MLVINVNVAVWNFQILREIIFCQFGFTENVCERNISVFSHCMEKRIVKRHCDLRNKKGQKSN